MSITFDNLFQDIDEVIESATKEIQLRVLVFGPDLEATEQSAILRKYIISKCNEDDYIVVLAEHDEIKQFYEERFPAAFDLCKMEYHLACHQTPGKPPIIDGIIIIPDSAGSFILCQAALSIAQTALIPGGSFACKIFQGEDFKAFSDSVRSVFNKYKIFKPQSSRKASKEIFIIGLEKNRR